MGPRSYIVHIHYFYSLKTSSSFRSLGLSVLLFVIIIELARLDAYQYVFIITSRCDIVSHDQFGVLLCTHSQVTEFAIWLIQQLSQGALGLHYQVADKCGILDGRQRTRVVLHGDSVKVHEDIAIGALLLHQCIQLVLYLTFFSCCLQSANNGHEFQKTFFGII